MAKIYLAGSGAFGAACAQALTNAGHTLLGIAAPEEGRGGRGEALTNWAMSRHLPRTSNALLRADDIPDGTDLILTAHSHAFVGRKTRARAPYALGYHPSLLPLHRGRAAVEWTARMNERVTGGTIYHLTDNVDGGPIAAQRHVILPPRLTASEIWREYLFPLGVEMVVDTADAVDAGNVPYQPQDERKATWEPSLDSKPLYRPELLELP
ncbi:methionyl-tRNA formyltransferase [Corynebacterium sp. HMSC055A01]|uniref:formyltransferase family protein n=1 Tax=Corynebacterium sp. HMSC055A01 TaxID=1715083 RepID=UPI0008A28F83|nr:formyltransferase family protein [Corynebacterium sp. HMSC055A01]OFN17786.1 methionyl-tRNA formyltransferase [Corynebacterium sp. HMSC055A01]